MYNRRAAVRRQGKSSNSHGSVTQVFIFLNIHVLRLIPKLVSHRLDRSPHWDGFHKALHKTPAFTGLYSFDTHTDAVFLGDTWQNFTLTTSLTDTNSYSLCGITFCYTETISALHTWLCVHKWAGPCHNETILRLWTCRHRWLLHCRFSVLHTQNRKSFSHQGWGGKCQNKHPIIHDTSSCWFKLALCRPCVENGSDLSSKWMCLCVQCGALVCVFWTRCLGSVVVFNALNVSWCAPLYLCKRELE